MSEQIATAQSCSNIAFIKYWGNLDNELRLPANGSISMNLRGLETVTTVQFSSHLEADQLFINDTLQTGDSLRRLTKHLDHIRARAQTRVKARVISINNFPTGTGIASSASGFAALTMAACAALDLDLDQRELSALARLGSGSACRSIPGGFVEWHMSDIDSESYATTIADAEHWDLVDLVAVVSDSHKAVGSTGGHALASTSSLQNARVLDTERRLAICLDAIAQRDFDSLGAVIEEDAMMMHGVMMTSKPPLIYWQPATLDVMLSVQSWRESGLPVAYTIDAGPNVHVITTPEHAVTIRERLETIEGITKVLIATPGGPATLLKEHLTRH